ncbi:hypothetical protein LCGC14_0651740 [marine sediment metagenome]|uniref:FAR-17a/AIG1-like protein n=2 Tax=root TaxID=1 RepID=A0A831QS20_9FLAO|nr:hypothetical protein [Pricia antarctica]
MKKNLELVGILLGWFAVIGQFILMLQNRVTDVPETIFRFFSFFTILTNTLVALYLTSKYFGFSNGLLSIFSRKSTLTALTTFILLVGTVYQLILRGIWEPEGLQRIIDELLHTIIPVYFLVYWYLYASASDIRLRPTLYWLLYPLLYFVFVIVKGHFSGFYPYPFLNANEIGYLGVAKSFLTILGITLLLMSLLVFFGRKK